MTPTPDVGQTRAARTTWDVAVVGAGHNGLIAALLLARAGLSVVVVEADRQIGGAARTERPFEKAPNLPTSTGAYLLGLVQPELIARLGLELPLLRRDPHYFLPTTEGRHLLFGSDEAALARALRHFFSERDHAAHLALQRELDALREDIAPTWLEEPRPLEETAERYVRPELREAFVNLCRGSVGDYLERFDFASPLLKAMYAVTDGFAGTFGGYRSPGTGMNFLVHNMCRLAGAAGTWMLPRGGMGAFTEMLARRVTSAGGHIVTGARVSHIESHAGAVRALALESGEVVRARNVVANCDPFTLQELVGRGTFPSEFEAWLAARRRPGSSFKLNLALRAFPRFSCLPSPPQPFAPTIHLLPDEDRVLTELDAAFEAAKNGVLPEFPSIEWYVHSTLDPSLTDEHGNLSSALFVQWVPYSLAHSDWDREVDGFCERLLAICDRFAPGTSDLVVDRMALHPQAIERHFGIRHGHIHHLDNSFGFDERFPHKTPLDGLYSCSAGTHPAGSVIGSAGYIAARRLLSDLGVEAPA